MNLSVPLPKDQKKLPVYVFFKDYNRVPLKVKRGVRFNFSWIYFLKTKLASKTLNQGKIKVTRTCFNSNFYTLICFFIIIIIIVH